MIDERIEYSIESFLYPAGVTRIELESGEADWVYVRRRVHQLADSRNEQVMLYAYNHGSRKWEYIGKALPGGDWYNWNGHGPYELSADGHAYHAKKGGEA